MLSKIFVFTAIFSPLFAYARHNQITDVASFFYTLTEIIFFVIPLLIGIALIIFLAGGVKFIKSSDNETERNKAKMILLYGIIGLFVIVSVWGLVNVLVNSFYLDDAPIQFKDIARPKINIPN